MGLGIDNDILTVWSLNDGVSWSSAQALHGSAGETDDEDWPRIVTDGDGLWTAAWPAVNDGQEFVLTPAAIFLVLSRSRPGRGGCAGQGTADHSKYRTAFE